MKFERQYFFHRIKLKIQMAWYDFVARCQRFKCGYSYSDVWDMDYWFITTVKPMLIHIRDYGMGVPLEFENNPDDWRAVPTEMTDCLTLMEEDNVYEKLFGENWFEMDLNADDYKLIWETMEANKTASLNYSASTFIIFGIEVHYENC